VDPLDIRCDDLFAKETRIRNCLRGFRTTINPYGYHKYHPIETVDQLLTVSRKELLRTRNFGKKSLHRLEQILWEETKLVIGFQCKTCGGHHIEATEGWEWFRCHECPPRWGRPEEFERTDS